MRKDYLEGELIIQDLSLREFRCSDCNSLNNTFNDDDEEEDNDGVTGESEESGLSCYFA